MQKLQPQSTPAEAPSMVNLQDLGSSTPWTAHLTFLIYMFIGAFMAAFLSGQFEVRYELSPMHSRIFGEPWEVWLVILFGGMMVGFGWAISGACPGLVFVQLGHGALPAVFTMFGITFGVWLYRKAHGRYFGWDTGTCGV